MPDDEAVLKALCALGHDPSAATVTSVREAINLAQPSDGPNDTDLERLVEAAMREINGDGSRGAGPEPARTCRCSNSVIASSFAEMDVSRHY